jgi:hypothetical protein
MEREDYAGLIYVLSSIVSVLIFSICLVIYLMYKQISVYLVGLGLLMLLTGFIAKRFIDKPGGK